MLTVESRRIGPTTEVFAGKPESRFQTSSDTTPELDDCSPIPATLSIPLTTANRSVLHQKQNTV